MFDGLYIQSQLAQGKFDFNLGWGVTRAHQVADGHLGRGPLPLRAVPQRRAGLVPVPHRLVGGRL